MRGHRRWGETYDCVNKSPEKLSSGRKRVSLFRLLARWRFFPDFAVARVTSLFFMYLIPHKIGYGCPFPLHPWRNNEYLICFVTRNRWHKRGGLPARVEDRFGTSRECLAIQYRITGTKWESLTLSHSICRKCISESPISTPAIKKRRVMSHDCSPRGLRSTRPKCSTGICSTFKETRGISRRRNFQLTRESWISKFTRLGKKQKQWGPWWDEFQAFHS